MPDAEQHPMRAAGLAMGGTVTLCSLLVFTWILPTQTAALNHEIVLLKEKIAKEVDQASALKRENENLARQLGEQKSGFQRKTEEMNSLITDLKASLFASQKANTFVSGNPYPIGLDRVKIGDAKSRITDSYDKEKVEEGNRRVIIKTGNDLFRFISYNHSSAESTEGRVDGIRFDLANRKGMDVPDGWLEASLRKSLGEPYLIGRDDDCLMWKTSTNEVVYHIRNSDWFEVSGYVTYPPGCHVTKEQERKYNGRSAGTGR
ncbi:hypothetical protein IVA95_27400 [Bradyrhizobium sp. 157]|uniref:hypothetical protein n=1 Tax=Bradyrhizobium sp. 157 TaxID=2782631 RepID=UPI001FFC04F6|nr:hypothetical protein [Bradyrhizobium sp. 157]MCK1641220.1 hypothetical protein [Bradyrhizobium sp. 157]